MHLRIVMACAYYPPFAPGGAEWTTRLLARALVNGEHAVTVVTPNYGAASAEVEDGVRILRFPFPRKLPRGQRSAGGIWLCNPVTYWWFARWIARVAHAEGADVIHAQHAESVIPAWMAGRKAHKPVVYTIRDTGGLCPIGATCLLHHEEVPGDCGFARMQRTCAPKYARDYVGPSTLAAWRSRLITAVRWPDSVRRAQILRQVQITGVSQGILRVYEDAHRLDRGCGMPVYALPPELPNESDLPSSDVTRDHLDIERGAKVVLCIGKQSPGKGTADLIAAADIVAASAPESVFVFAGKGKAPRPNKARALFLGSLPQRDVLALYRAADLVVSPSVWPEPLSRVLLEAGRFGLPCVATRVGGTAEAVIDGETGVLVPRSNPTAMAEAISRLLTNDELRQRMGDAARRHVLTTFTPERTLQQITSAYEHAIANTQGTFDAS